MARLTGASLLVLSRRAWGYNHDDFSRGEESEMMGPRVYQ